MSPNFRSGDQYFSVFSFRWPYFSKSVRHIPTKKKVKCPPGRGFHYILVITTSQFIDLLSTLSRAVENPNSVSIWIRNREGSFNIAVFKRKVIILNFVRLIFHAYNLVAIQNKWIWMLNFHFKQRLLKSQNQMQLITYPYNIHFILKILVQNSGDKCMLWISDTVHFCTR